MPRIPLVLAAVLLAAADATGAAEIDSLSGRGQPLRDSRAALEARLEAALREGVERANRSEVPCDEEALYEAVRDALASPFIGHRIAEDLQDDPALDRRHVRREESIYRDLGWLENPSVHLKDLGAVVRVGDTLVGVDKLGHFLVEGWHYFEKAYLDGEGVEAALAWGEHTERTYFGLYTTGVYSYADLVANFEGMRFWLRLTGRAPDPLGPSGCAARPRLVCRRRFWIAGPRRWRLRALDLSEHVSPVWDEAVNCPAYRNPEIEGRVGERIAELEAAGEGPLSCPLRPEACAEARRRYGDFAARLLHPACLAARPAERPWWRFWRGASPREQPG